MKSIEQHHGASKTWTCFKVSAAPPLTPRHHRCLSVEGNAAVRAVKDSATGSFLAKEIVKR